MTCCTTASGRQLGLHTDDTKQWVHKNNADWTMAGYTQGSFFTVTPTDDFDFNQYDEVAVQNENAEPSVLLGFSMDVTPVSDQLNQCISIAESYIERAADRFLRRF